MRTVFFLIKRKVLSYNIHIGSVKDFTRSIDVLKKQKRPSSVLLATPFILNKGQSDGKLNNALQNADILIPKSGLVNKSLMWLYNSDADIISGLSLLDSLIKNQELSGFYFLGEEKIYTQFLKKYPYIKIVRVFEEEFKELSSEINRSDENLLIVCLPTVEQEKWIEEAKSKVNACILGLGDIYYSPSFFSEFGSKINYTAKVFKQKIAGTV